MSSRKHTITVAGDICINWLQFPIKAKDSGLNWELHPGIKMAANVGGALMLTEFLRKSTKASVASAELSEIRNVPPEKVIHSITELELFPYSTDQKDKGKLVYRVKQFKGFTGPNACLSLIHISE